MTISYYYFDEYFFDEYAPFCDYYLEHSNHYDYILCFYHEGFCIDVIDLTKLNYYKFIVENEHDHIIGIKLTDTSIIEIPKYTFLFVKRKF